MITLPKNWRQWVQIRDYANLDTRENVLGTVCLVMGNDAGQLYGFEQNVIVPSYLKAQLTKEDLVMFYEIAYNTLVAMVPDMAFKQLNVFARDDNDHITVQPVEDQNWEPLWDEAHMVPYEEFMTNLKGV